MAWISQNNHTSNTLYHWRIICDKDLKLTSALQFSVCVVSKVSVVMCNMGHWTTHGLNCDFTSASFKLFTLVPQQSGVITKGHALQTKYLFETKKINSCIKETSISTQGQRKGRLKVLMDGWMHEWRDVFLIHSWRCSNGCPWLPYNLFAYSVFPCVIPEITQNETEICKHAQTSRYFFHLDLTGLRAALKCPLSAALWVWRLGPVASTSFPVHP